MFDDKIGLIELVIFLLIAFVLPAIAIVGDDRNWERKERRKIPAAQNPRAQTGDAADAGLAGGST
jgi:hypothetical protein